VCVFFFCGACLFVCCLFHGTVLFIPGLVSLEYIYTYVVVCFGWFVVCFFFGMRVENVARNGATDEPAGRGGKKHYIFFHVVGTTGTMRSRMLVSPSSSSISFRSFLYPLSRAKLDANDTLFCAYPRVVSPVWLSVVRF